MTTFKSFTDLQQSKKLAEILPLDSADMYYVYMHTDDKGGGRYNQFALSGWKKELSYDEDIPAWSLSALMDILPMIRKGEDTANPFIAKTSDGEYYIVYATLTEEVYDSSIYDNPVDACVAMIEKLHELKML